MIRVPVCARVSCVSRVCPGSPRCLFTGTVPAPPGVFLPVLYLYCTGNRYSTGKATWDQMSRSMRDSARATALDVRYVLNV